MIRTPALMTPDERTREVASLLARGYLRSLTRTSVDRALHMDSHYTLQAESSAELPRCDSRNEQSRVQRATNHARENNEHVHAT